MIKFEFPEGRPAVNLEPAWDCLLQLKDARFFELPTRQKLWQESQARAQEIRKNFDVSCIVGIGGSSLGGRALQRSFAATSGHRLEFIEAPDETAARRWRSELGPLQRVHFVFISKSGKTLETLTILDFWTQVLKESNLDIARQSTVICGPNSNPLLEWAKQHSVPVLNVPEDIGGRFSVLSPVGLLPAALLGMSLDGLRSGAEWGLSQKDTVLRLANHALHDLQDKRWITQMWVYSDAFYVLGLWWQQLWSESLAKTSLRRGGAAPRVSTPMVCLGPQDQHSLLQQLQEGAADKSVILFRDDDSEKSGQAFPSPNLGKLDPSLKKTSLGEILKAEVEGFCGALRETKVPTLVLKAPSSRPESWGAFFMIWELVIGVMGEYLGINAFDQPGVELGKRLALESLRRR